MELEMVVSLGQVSASQSAAVMEVETAEMMVA